MTNPVTSTRQGIENVRHSLGRIAQTPIGLPPRIFPARQPGSPDVEIEHFLGEIKKLSGVGQRLAPDRIDGALKTLVAEQNIRKAVLWATPRLQFLGLPGYLRAIGVQVVSPKADKHELAQCDLGITEADFILPETGTLVLRCSAEKPRAVSLLPRVHLAIINPAALRADMHQVFAEAKDSHYLVFITGPSRTADIELTITLGVHGPKNLYVWMMTA